MRWIWSVSAMIGLTCALAAATLRPADAQDVLFCNNRVPETPQQTRVTSYGYAEIDSIDSLRRIVFAMIVDNPNNQLTSLGINYDSILQDESASVYREEGYGTFGIAPRGRLGIADMAEVDVDADVVLLNGRAVATSYSCAEVPPQIRISEVIVPPSVRSPEVVVVADSPLRLDLDDVRFSAVAYGADGRIMGGGFQFVSFNPRGGRQRFTIKTYTPVPPARVEVYSNFGVPR